MSVECFIPKMIVSSLFLLSTLLASSFGTLTGLHILGVNADVPYSAHEDHDEPSDISLFRRNNLDERHEIQKRCGGTLEAIHRRRLARRGVLGPQARSEHIPRAALCSMTGQVCPYYIPPAATP